MKHSIFTHSLLALCIAAAGYCGTLSAQAKTAPADAKAAAAKAAAEKKAAEAARKKAEAERKKAEAEARKKAQAEAKARMDKINNLANTMEKTKVRYKKRIEDMKALLAQEDIKADAACRYRINSLIISYCFPPGWTRISLFNYDTADTELIPAAEAIINDKDIPAWQKTGVYSNYVEYLSGKDRHKEAEAIAKRSIEFFAKSNLDTAAAAYGNLAKAYRYQDRYEDAMAVCREAMKIHKRTGVNLAVSNAMAFSRGDVVKKIWMESGMTKEMLDHYAKYGGRDAEIMDIAYKFVMDEKNNLGQRFNIAMSYFMGTDARSKEVRAALKGVPAQLKYNYWNNPIESNYQLGGYDMVVELFDFFAGAPLLNNPKMQRMHVISCGAIGKAAEGAKFAAEYAKNEKLAPVDRMRLNFYEAILSGKSTDNLMKDTKLSRKEQSQVYLSAARTCQIWSKSDLAEKYAKLYQSFYAQKEERTINVKYFDTPVKNITAWRKVYPQLEKQYCDIPYRGSMDFLETDVATGDRGNIKADEKAEQKKYLELTTLCDRYGLHIFLRAEDANARKIEQGFARGYGCEMYFAPGRNQPYACMGSDAARGVTFIFDTTYNNLNHTRYTLTDPKTFMSEVEFTDNDYVLHLFFSWDLYYNKLPAKGTDYRFDALAWGPAGGFSWGGSQGIHAAGSWGNLRFNLSDKQLNEIRKEVIFRNYRTFRNIVRDPGVRENLFECWADPGIGDPEFYHKHLIPLHADLNKYVKMIKADMTDAEVVEVYTKALPKMKGLAHEVDQLRRKYLTEKFLED